MRLINVIGFLILSNSVFAQKHVASQAFLDKVIEYYRGLQNMELKMDYLIYNDHTTQQIAEMAKGHYIKKGKNHYLKRYGTTMILMQNDLLIRDDSTQMIVLSKVVQNEVQDMNQFTSKLAGYELVSESKRTKGERYFVLKMPDNKVADIRTVEVSVNEKTLQIKNMTLYYSKQFDVSEDPRKPIFKQPRMKLVYWHFDDDPTPPHDLFELDQYVTIDQEGNKKLTAQYQSYEFIHQ